MGVLIRTIRALRKAITLELPGDAHAARAHEAVFAAVELAVCGGQRLGLQVKH